MTTSTFLGKFPRGEKPPAWLHTFKDSAGDAIDLTGFSVTAVWEVKGETGFTPVEITGSLSDATNGIVSTPWGSQSHSPFSAVTASGAAITAPYSVEIEVWAGNGSVRYSSGKYRFTVLDAVAATTPSI